MSKQFKAGIGLLLFGIILANTGAFNIGWILWTAACVLGVVGLVLIFTDFSSDNKQ